MTQPKRKFRFSAKDRVALAFATTLLSTFKDHYSNKNPKTTVRDIMRDGRVYAEEFIAEMRSW